MYQYYATVNYRTCERCLLRHGEIFSDLKDAPPIHQGCRCLCLEFEESELEKYKEKGKRMKIKAEREFKRRKLFQAAVEALGKDSQKSIKLFREAVSIEIYLPEIEELFCKKKALIKGDSKLAKSLRNIFIQGYWDKFDQEKYNNMPEGMLATQQAYGLKRIRELFDEAI